MSHIKYTTLGLIAVACLNFVASYAREIIIAMVFGTGPVTDAFIASYGFVVTLGEMTFGAMLAASIVPALMGLSGNVESRESWQRLVASLSLILLSVTCVLAVALYFLFPHILAFIVPGFDAETYGIALSLSRELVWFLPLQAMLALFILTLNTRHYYIFPACAYLVVNTVFSLTIALLHNTEQYQALPTAVLLGNAIAAILLGGQLYRMGTFRHLQTSRVLLKSVWHPARNMLLSLGLGSSIGLLLASHLILRYYASYQDTGSVAALGFGFRIYEVPLTLIANTAALLALTNFSAMHIAGNVQRMTEIIRHMITWGVIILVPMSVVAYLYAENIISLLLERGSFNHDSTLVTAGALKGFAPAIVFEATYVVFFRIFYALKATRVPVQAGFLSIAVLIVLLESIHPESLQAVALCLSASFACTALFVIGKIIQRFGAAVLPHPQEIIKPLIAAFLLAFAWLHILPPTNNLTTILSVLAYVGTYAGALWFLMPRARGQLLRLVAP